jgi:hypothetical protein
MFAIWQPKMNIYYVAAKETMQAGFFATYFGMQARSVRTDVAPKVLMY